MIIEELARNYVSLYKTAHNKQVFLGWERDFAGSSTQFSNDNGKITRFKFILEGFLRVFKICLKLTNNFLLMKHMTNRK